MKKTITAVALAAALPLSATSALANVNVMPAQEVTAQSLTSYNQSRDAYREFAGDYQLTDGKVLSLVQHGRAFYARVDGQARIEVHATSGNRFVSSNGAAELVFAHVDNAGKTEVVLTQYRVRAA